VINVERRIAAAIIAAPTRIDIELVVTIRSGVAALYPGWYSF
jgi:hypothetical protein